MSNKAQSHSHKVALITGAATGIGRACSVRLADDGYVIAANYRSQKSEIDRLIADLPAGTHCSVAGDLSDPATPPKLVENVIDQYGRLDLLVNAAGVFFEHDITTIGYEEWQSALQVNIATNLTGAMNLAFCAAQPMMKAKSGVIVNITSRGAFRGEPDAPAYGASKAGLNSASQSMAKALAPHGISVFAVAPGWVETPLAKPYLQGATGDAVRSQSPLNRVGTPSEIAHLVAFLAGGGTEYLTGAIIDMNGASYLRN